MVDSSLDVFDIAAVTAADGRVRGYGVGRNGDLQALSFPGMPASAGTARGGGRRGATAPAEQRRRGRGGRRRRRRGGHGPRRRPPVGHDPSVRRPGDPDGRHGKWQVLTDLASSSDHQVDEIPNGRPPGPVVAVAPGGVGVAAVLFGVAQGALHALKVPTTGRQPTRSGSGCRSRGRRRPRSPEPGRSPPCRAPTGRAPARIRTGTGGGRIRGSHQGRRVAGGPSGRSTQTDCGDLAAPGRRRDRGAWQSAALDVHPPPPGSAYRPRVTARAGAGHLWVAYARSSGDPKLAPCSTAASRHRRRRGDAPPRRQAVGEKTALHANPAFARRRRPSGDGRPGPARGGDSSGSDRTRSDHHPAPRRSTTTGRPLVVQTETETRTGAKKGPSCSSAAPTSGCSAPRSPSRRRSRSSCTTPCWWRAPSLPTRWRSAPISRTPPSLVELGDGNRRIAAGRRRVYESSRPLSVGMALTFLGDAEPTGRLPGFVPRLRRAGPSCGSTANDHDTAVDSRLDHRREGLTVVESVDVGARVPRSNRGGRHRGRPVPDRGRPPARPARTADLGTLAELSAPSPTPPRSTSAPGEPLVAEGAAEANAGSGRMGAAGCDLGRGPDRHGPVRFPGTVDGALDLDREPRSSVATRTRSCRGSTTTAKAGGASRQQFR